MKQEGVLCSLLNCILIFVPAYNRLFLPSYAQYALAK